LSSKESNLSNITEF
jgi:hypothetical protein